jgi:hypothetical protein
MTATELFAECPRCPSWQVQVFGDAEKRRLEDKHNARKHAETAENITEAMYDDPSHQGDREAIEAAIRAVARFHNGTVDPNKVRKQLPSHVQPQMVGTVYRVMKNRGALVVIGEVENTDTKGRNTHHRLPLYRLREAS